MSPDQLLVPRPAPCFKVYFDHRTNINSGCDFDVGVMISVGW